MERIANILYILAKITLSLRRCAVKVAIESSYGFIWETGYSGIPVLLSAIRRTRQKGWFVQKFVNTCWVFDYSISHYGKYKVGRRSRIWRERPARVGHLYPPRVLYAEDLHKARHKIEDAWVIFHGGETIGLREFIPKGCFYARFLDSEGVCLPLLEKAALIGKVEGMRGFWKAQSVFFELIGLLISAQHVKNETYRITSGGQKPNCSSWLASVQEYLRSHCAHSIHLGDIARHFNVSVSTLCHRYHVETGQSPINDHLKMRIELAKNLLLKGQRLKEIAEDAGFYDQYHLSKMFKQVTGTSPRQFVGLLAEDVNH